MSLFPTRGRAERFARLMGITTGAGVGQGFLRNLIRSLQGRGTFVAPGAGQRPGGCPPGQQRFADLAGLGTGLENECMTRTEHDALLDFLGDQAGDGRGRYLEEDLALERERARLSALESERDRAFRLQLERMANEARRQEQIRELRQARQAAFVELLGRDPARATLFALGLGPEADVFNVNARALGVTLEPLKGAEKLRQRTERALTGLQEGRRVRLGERGALGLRSPEKLARAVQFQPGGESGTQLLLSALGIGSLRPGEQPGLTAEEVLRRAQEVTPTGVLGF